MNYDLQKWRTKKLLVTLSVNFLYIYLLFLMYNFNLVLVYDFIQLIMKIFKIRVSSSLPPFLIFPILKKMSIERLKSWTDKILNLIDRFNQLPIWKNNRKIKSNQRNKTAENSMKNFCIWSICTIVMSFWILLCWPSDSATLNMASEGRI